MTPASVSWVFVEVVFVFAVLKTASKFVSILEWSAMPASIIEILMRGQKEVKMGRDEAIQKGLDALLQGQKDALGGAFDDGAASVPAGGGGFSQADMDKAVADAVAAAQGVDAADLAQKIADLQAADAQAMSDAKAVADQAFADLQKQFSDVSAAKSAEDAVVQGLQSGAAQIKAAYDALIAIIQPSQP